MRARKHINVESVNDSLIGRRSKPFIAKVWKCCELLGIVKSVH